MVTIEQIKAARALINWAQQDMADETGLSKTAIANIESGKHRPTEKNMQNIISAFDRNGVEFIDGGVRQKQNLLRVLEGYKGIRQFYDDVYLVASRIGGEFLVYGVDEEKFTEAAFNAGVNELYRERMASIKENISFKVLIGESDQNENAAEHCEYKKLPDHMMFPDAPFYIYGDNLALIVWRNPPKVIIISDQDLVEAYKRQFGFLWKNAKTV